MALLFLILAIAIVWFTGHMPRRQQITTAAGLLVGAVILAGFGFDRPPNAAAVFIFGFAATGGLSGVLILLRVFVAERKDKR